MDQEYNYRMFLNGDPVCVGVDSNGKGIYYMKFPYNITQEDVKKRFGNFDRLEIKKGDYINIILYNC